MSPAAIAWTHRLALLVHIAGVVVWMGAVAYYLFILRPALDRSGMERRDRYPLLIAIKHQLRKVVGVAVVMIVASGLYNAWLRGLLQPGTGVAPLYRRVFAWKMVIVGVLVLTYLFALPLLQRVKVARVRGRLFNGIHVAVLALGILAAAAGVVLAG